MTRSKRRRAPEQLELLKKRGGKRRGAGRPPKRPRAGAPHKKRPFLHSRYPVHVTLRAISFPGWVEYGGSPWLWPWPATYEPLITYRPKTWLLAESWKKAGTISCREVPSARR